MPGHVLAEHANAARRRQKQAKKHAHRRGLACAVTAQERGDTAATDGERNVIHRPRRAVTLGEPDRGDGRRRGVRIWQHGGRASWLRAPAPASGGTAGRCVVFASGADAGALASDERRHVVRNLILGPLLMPLYVLLWLAYGYERHPLERGARAAEDVA